MKKILTILASLELLVGCGDDTHTIEQVPVEVPGECRVPDNVQVDVDVNLPSPEEEPEVEEPTPTAEVPTPTPAPGVVCEIIVKKTKVIRNNHKKKLVFRVTKKYCTLTEE